MQDVSIFQLIVGICVGISLSAACGFRVFLPLLAVSIAVHFFGYKVSADFEWIGSWISIVSLATATIVEVAAYYLPCVDNLLDLVNVPLAFAAGAVVMSGVLPDVHPYLNWSIAGLLGSSAAGLTQLATTIIRGASTATTAGVGNNVVSSSENVCATIFSLACDSCCDYHSLHSWKSSEAYRGERSEAASINLSERAGTISYQSMK